MKRSRSRTIFGAALAAAAVYLLLLGYGETQAAEETVLEASAVIDLKATLEQSEPATARFSAIVGNKLGLFIWVESGSPRSGAGNARVIQTDLYGRPLRTLQLPPASRLTVSHQFDVDTAGNVYVLRSEMAPDRQSETALLAKIDSQGEIVEQYALEDRPTTFCVTEAGRCWVVSDGGELLPAASPRLPRIRVTEPPREFPDAPATWWPLLQALPSGGFALVDGISALQYRVSANGPAKAQAYQDNTLRAVLARNRAEAEQQRRERPEQVRFSSHAVAIQSAARDGDGRLFVSLTGTRPSLGLVVLLTGPDGAPAGTLRLMMPLDPVRSSGGEARSEALREKQFMFPQGIAVADGRIFVLSPSGQLAAFTL